MDAKTPLLFALLVAVVALGPVTSDANIRPLGDGAVVTPNPVSPDGVPVQLDLPRELHIRNVGGSDAAGLCVFSSCNMSAYWQNEPALWGFQKWMTQYPGGGYPAKVDAKIAQLCKEKGLPVPKYVQVESADTKIHELMCRTGRMPGVTYSYSPSKRYGGARIAHMVTLLHADERWVCVLDNNFPGTYEWIPRPQWPGPYTGNGKAGWTFCLLKPGPPPPPK